MELWHWFVIGLLALFAIAASIVSPFLANGDIVVAPDAFEVKSITDAAGTSKNPNFVGRFARYPNLDAINMAPYTRNRIIAGWFNVDTVETDKTYRIYLRRMGDSVLDPRLELSFHTYTESTGVETHAFNGVLGTASTVFAATSPLLYDGLWSTSSALGTGSTALADADSSDIDRQVEVVAYSF